MTEPIQDTRRSHSEELECYCNVCCATAIDWYEWRDPTNKYASGARYWTIEDALRVMNGAFEDGLTVLVHQPDGVAV